jgi:hypothetical protein
VTNKGAFRLHLESWFLVYPLAKAFGVGLTPLVKVKASYFSTGNGPRTEGCSFARQEPHLAARRFEEVPSFLGSSRSEYDRQIDERLAKLSGGEGLLRAHLILSAFHVATLDEDSGVKIVKRTPDEPLRRNAINVADELLIVLPRVHDRQHSRAPAGPSGLGRCGGRAFIASGAHRHRSWVVRDCLSAGRGEGRCFPE